MSLSNTTEPVSGGDGRIDSRENTNSTTLVTLKETDDCIVDHPSLSQLCFHCQNVANNWDAFYAGASLPHFSDLDSLKASALSCKLCAQLLQEYPFERSWKDSEQFWQNKIWDTVPPGIIKLDKNCWSHSVLNFLILLCALRFLHRRNN